MRGKTMTACMLVDVNKFEIREVPVPEVGFGEVLCRIRAVAICGTDPEIVNGSRRTTPSSWATNGPGRL